MDKDECKKCGGWGTIAWDNGENERCLDCNPIPCPACKDTLNGYLTVEDSNGNECNECGYRVDWK